MKLILLLLVSWMALRVESWADSVAVVRTEYSWGDVARTRKIVGAELVTTNGGILLQVVHTNGQAAQVPLLRIEKPAVKGVWYGVTGRVRYERVEGEGYLEMWSVFPAKSSGASERRFFTRTLGATGEMRTISGSSPWRSFSLPFNRSASPEPPEALEVNLQLPGRGLVLLDSLKLVEYSGEPASLLNPGTSGAWWSARQGNLFCAVGGSVLGCLGGMIGWLGSRGRSRRLVLTVCGGMFWGGLLCLGVGIVGVVLRQPFLVWYPPLLLGLISTSVMGFGYRRIRAGYAALELRRMAASDA
jgi:hypothetical protein